MKALAYEKAHTLQAYAIQEMQVAEPELRDADLLVDIRAVGVNPGEALIRSLRSAEAGGRIILGWEFAGVVLKVGATVKGFAVGDHIMGTGDVSRDGCWAERDRKSVVSGKSVSVRVDLGSRRMIKKKMNISE